MLTAKQIAQLPLKERIEIGSIPVPESGCWLWLGHWTTGYGSLSIKDKSVSAHRVSWEAYRGPIPEGLIVCHRCDTPACCNPDHLFIGTHKDNCDDKIMKGRQRNGIRSKGWSRTPITHCYRGHERTQENTYLHKNGKTCRACNKIAVLKYQEKKRTKRNKELINQSEHFTCPREENSNEPQSRGPHANL